MHPSIIRLFGSVFEIFTISLEMTPQDILVSIFPERTSSSVIIVSELNLEATIENNLIKMASVFPQETL